jgi:hypothetical protein
MSGQTPERDPQAGRDHHETVATALVETLRVLVADWRKVANSLKDRHGIGDARERNTLEVIIAHIEAILAETQPAGKPRWTKRFGPVVACEHDPQLVRDLEAERNRHRERLAMLLADTPFEFRPDWAAEYDDYAPKDGLVAPPAESQSASHPATEQDDKRRKDNH